MNKKCLVKRKGHDEEFDERKLYASVYSAATVAHYKEAAAETIASETVIAVENKITPNERISSDDLRQMVHDYLKEKDEEVAFLYLSHLDVN